jgi:hypothetical protein
MHPNKGYDLAMRRLMMSAVGMLALALLAPFSPAQVRGVPAPDNNQGHGRSTAVQGSPRGHASVMPTPIGVSPAPAPSFPRPTPIGVPPTLPVPGTDNVGFGGGLHHHRRHPNNFFGGAYPVYVPVPVVVDPYSMYQAAPDQGDEDADDQAVVPGPTVFERRSPGEATAEQPDEGMVSAAAAPPTPAAEPSPSPAASAAASQPAQPEDPSVLVFRDGHRLEVKNYAIVGDTLYDFTLGHMRKVPLSQLDLTATVKANDERGVDFVLPASPKGN